MGHLVQKGWRKRAGVEPTGPVWRPLPVLKTGRPTGERSLPLFMCRIAPCDAAQDMVVAHAASVADAIEEFEDVDRHFAAATDLVAQGGGARAPHALQSGDPAARSATAPGGEIMVVRDRIDFAGAGDALEQGAHRVFGDAGGLRNIAHARRVVGLASSNGLSVAKVTIGGASWRGVPAGAARRGSGRCDRGQQFATSASKAAGRVWQGQPAQAVAFDADACRGALVFAGQGGEQRSVRPASAGAKAVWPPRFRSRWRPSAAAALSRFQLARSGPGRRPPLASPGQLQAGCRIRSASAASRASRSGLRLWRIGGKMSSTTAAGDGVACRGVAQNEVVAARAGVAVDGFPPVPLPAPFLRSRAAQRGPGCLRRRDAHAPASSA